MALVLKLGVIERALAPGESVIGRHAGCDIVVNDGAVSRTHAKVLVFGNEVTIEDLDSANGTYVNDLPVRGPTRLPLGGRLRVGDTEFELALSVRSAPPPPEPRRDSDVPLVTRTHSRIGVLTRAVERALSESKVEQARTILEPALHQLLSALESPHPPDANTVVDAATVAAAVAAAKPDPDWNAWPLRLYAAAKFVLPQVAARTLIPAIAKAGVAADVAGLYLERVSAEHDYAPLRRALEQALGGVTSPTAPPKRT